MVLDARVGIPFLEHPPFLLLFSHDTYWVSPKKTQSMSLRLAQSPWLSPTQNDVSALDKLCQTPFSTKGWGSRHQMVGKALG